VIKQYYSLLTATLEVTVLLHIAVSVYLSDSFNFVFTRFTCVFFKQWDYVTVMRYSNSDYMWIVCIVRLIQLNRWPPCSELLYNTTYCWI